MTTPRLYFGILRDSLKSFGRLFVFRKLSLVEIRNESIEQSVKTFVFKSSRPLSYKAGQYGIWLASKPVKGKPGRLFTISSAPEEGTLQFTTYVSSSAFKRYINDFTTGSTLFIEGPIGEFVLPDPLPERVVFVAGGIGVTPVRAIAKHVAINSLPVKMTLVHSARNFFLFKDELQPLMEQVFYPGRDELIDTLADIAKQQPAAVYYVAGPPGFVDAAVSQLRVLGIKEIKTDGFLGY